MAKCKDCGEKTGFLVARCSACTVIYDNARALEQEGLEKKNRENAEISKFASAKANLYFTEDKFVDKKQYSTADFSLKHPRGYGFAGNLKMRWTAMSDGTVWLTATQRMADWDWLYDNTTIFLMPGGKKFIQENIELRDHETQTSGYDVVCIETHIVNVTEIFEELCDFYHSNTLNEAAEIEARIGHTEFALNVDKLRLAAALREFVQDKF